MYIIHSLQLKLLILPMFVVFILDKSFT